MRIRSIWPKFWHDQKLWQVSDGAALLFIAMLNQADDEGRMEYKPFEIEQAAPRFIKKAKRYLNELEKEKLFIRYGNKKQYLYFPNFRKYQHPNKPTPSRLPKPNGDKSKPKRKKARL